MAESAEKGIMPANIEQQTQRYLDELVQRYGLGSFTICNTDQEIHADALVQCATCRTVMSRIEIAEEGYRCNVCGSRVCIECGCTDDRPCLWGCSWIGPGICSTHEAELRGAVKRVFGKGI